MNLLQMVLYDTPGVLQEQRHKLDSMMMQNVRSAAVNADCVLILVDACKAPEKVWFLVYKTVTFFLLFSESFLSLD
jgi:GTPase Era involved in 16S rRNA processing